MELAHANDKGFLLANISLMSEFPVLQPSHIAREASAPHANSAYAPQALAIADPPVRSLIRDDARRGLRVLDVVTKE